ncbi:MAG: zinc-binding alcohol dehydrogenase family protein [Actinobacteria bacterium]|nr:zinc-binding alcohol dehydrogenase family protein [Actinomycetota bacterium]
MRAAQIGKIGEPPAVHELDRPARDAGAVLVAVKAVALNPLDIAVGGGRFYGGHPPLPYVPGCEAVGTVVGGDVLAEGARVYLFGGGLGVKRGGTLAELVAAPADAVFSLPAEADEAVAVACGCAGVAGWAATTRRAAVGPDDTVLVLAATGTVGSVALQAARLRGARRIVAAGRRRDVLRRALGRGADAIVSLDDGDTLAARLKEACGGDGPTVVIDPVWGAPLAAAVEAAAPRARVVNIGQSAAPETTLLSGTVRGKQLSILGYSNFAVARDEFGSAYLELLEHATAGRVELDVETFPLEDVSGAWNHQSAGSGSKPVVIL